MTAVSPGAGQLPPLAGHATITELRSSSVI
jgi:hypothetical protein